MTQGHQLVTQNLHAGYHKFPVLKGIDLTIPRGKISVILGSNACGKSTLLKTLARLIKPEQGTVSLDGKPLGQWQEKKLARILGLLPQSPLVPEGITVADLVGRGRYPHLSFFGTWNQHDYSAVSEALGWMGIQDLANRTMEELSGGQRQKVWIAMALAQQTDLLLLDEPTTYLDIAHQVEILDILADLNKHKGTTIVMVLHEINLSVRYADWIIAMKSGQVISQGVPKDIITKQLIQDVYSMNCTVITDPVSQTPLVVPIGKHSSPWCPRDLTFE
jgi:iron complex transport system ATP-binding protein